MKTYQLIRKQFLKTDLQTAWEFFSSPANLAMITPKNMNFEILSMSGGAKMHTGQVIRYKVNVLPVIRMTWVTEITNVQEPFSFTDEQKSGPCKLWRHTHRFSPTEGGVEMIDEVKYILPLGFLGRLAHVLFAGQHVNRIFDYRFQVLEKHFNLKG